MKTLSAPVKSLSMTHDSAQQLQGLLLDPGIDIRGKAVDVQCCYRTPGCCRRFRGLSAADLNELFLLRFGSLEYPPLPFVVRVQADAVLFAPLACAHDVVPSA